MPYDVPPGADVLTGSDGSWSAGRVVTLVVPLARSLARLHAQGLVHGAVGRYAVRCTPEGKPEFVDAVGSRARSASATPAADVRALARLGLRLLDPASADGGGVRAALEAAARGKLDAAGLAERLMGATRAEPLLAAVRPAPTSHRRPRRGRVSAGRFGRRFAPPNRVGRTPGSRRGVLAVLFGVGGVVALVVAAFVSGSSAGTTLRPATESTVPVTTATPKVSSNDWMGIVSRLTAARVDALTRGKPSLLRRVYGREAAAADADASLLRQWRVQHRRVVGFEASVVGVDPVRTTSRVALLDVTTELSAYRIVDGRGIAVARSAGEQQVARLLLVRRDGRWLVRQVRAIGPQSTSAATAASTSS
jgi:hypothetical protein